jgi:6-phosphogluconate dehydrogenase
VGWDCLKPDCRAAAQEVCAVLEEESPMELGMIGLGRMGANMTQRLLAGGHRVVAFDRQDAAVQRVTQAGGTGADSLESLVGRLSVPRSVWLMLPAGEAVDGTISSLAGLLERGDVVIDGGNSNYRDTVRRAEAIRAWGGEFVDVGTSGGIWGGSQGYCLMIGGENATVERLRPLFETLAPAGDRGWAHLGKAGAGHFAKMVHNGIEYGMMQAYAEGFALLEKNTDFQFDLEKIAETWRHGSVVRSWLLDLTADALRENPGLKGIAPHVEDSGEGRWMVAEAIGSGVPCPVITLSLLERIRSRVVDSFGNKMLAVMRNKFGGHAMRQP